MRDGVILLARIFLAALFLILGWRKLRDYRGTFDQMVRDGASPYGDGPRWRGAGASAPGLVRLGARQRPDRRFDALKHVVRAKTLGHAETIEGRLGAD